MMTDQKRSVLYDRLRKLNMYSDENKLGNRKGVMKNDGIKETEEEEKEEAANIDEFKKMKEAETQFIIKTEKAQEEKLKYETLRIQLEKYPEERRQLRKKAQLLEKEVARLQRIIAFTQTVQPKKEFERLTIVKSKDEFIKTVRKCIHYTVVVLYENFSEFTKYQNTTYYKLGLELQNNDTIKHRVIVICVDNQNGLLKQKVIDPQHITVFPTIQIFSNASLKYQVIQRSVSLEDLVSLVKSTFKENEKLTAWETSHTLSIQNQLKTEIDIKYPTMNKSLMDHFVPADSVALTGKVLGSGGYGVVLEAILYKNIKIAAKTCTNRFDSKDMLMFLQEMTFTLAVSGPYTIALYGVTYIGDEWYLLMELCASTAAAVLYDAKRKIDKNHKLYYRSMLKMLIDIGNGLLVLHQQNRAHFDLKWGNVLITTHNQIKISDFGLARFFSSLYPNDVNPGGTPPYRPPEAFRQKTSPSADVYSFGVMLAEVYTIDPKAFSWKNAIVSNEQRFSDDKFYLFDNALERYASDMVIIQNMIELGKLRPRYPENMPRDVRDLCEKCLKFNPDDRISMMEVLPALTQIYNKL